MSGENVVKLKEVSDFVTPSQKCILPFSKTKEDENKKPEGEVGVKIKSRKKLNISTNVPKTRVKVTLEDCLACSGCVTTAELEW